MDQEQDLVPEKRHDLLKWYMECAQRDEHFNIDGFEKRIRFFSGLNVAIIAAVVAGYFKADDWPDYALLIVGPALMLGLNRPKVTWEGLKRYYDRFLDAIIVKAHIEQALGLTRPLIAKQDDTTFPEEGTDREDRTGHTRRKPYWITEPPIPERHLEKRYEHRQGSCEWRKDVENLGSKQFVDRLFGLYQKLAVILLVVFVATAYTHSPFWAAAPQDSSTLKTLTTSESD